jgi:predicted CopG family antitoxin
MPLNGFKSVTVPEDAYKQAKQLASLGLEENIGKAFANAIRDYVEKKQQLINELLSVKEKWSKKGV